MSTSPESSRLGASPGKLALIAVLAVILIAVIAVQFGSGSHATEGPERDPNSEGRTSTPHPEPAGSDPARSPKSGKAQETAPPWPTVDLSDVLEHDSFAASATFSSRRDSAAANRKPGPSAREEELARRRAEQDQSLEELRQQGVKAVVGSTRRGHAAIIGSQTVRPGDVLDGFRVIAIDSDGVVLERLAIE